MDKASPARLYALLVGLLLVAAGIAGFFYNSHFGSGNDLYGADTSYKLLGVLAVNGWANVAHIVIGALGLLVAGYAARAYALGLGSACILIAILGFIGGNGYSVLSLVPVNTADSFLHLIIGLLGVAAGLASEERGGAPAAA